SYGQCKASLRNGQRCRVVIETEGSHFCPHHMRLAEEHGADAVVKGGARKRGGLRVVEEQKLAIVATIDEPSSTIPIDPAGVRPMLAEAAAENAEQLKVSLLEAAGSAVRPIWLTVECSSCGERSRVEAPVPDGPPSVAANRAPPSGRPGSSTASRGAPSVASPGLRRGDREDAVGRDAGALRRDLRGRDRRYPNPRREGRCAREDRWSLGFAAGLSGRT